MILITGNSRTGTTLLLALFGLSGMNTGYTRNQLLREVNKTNRRYYDLRGGLDFFFMSSMTKKANAKEVPDIIKQAYCLKYGCNSPTRIIELHDRGREKIHIDKALFRFSDVIITYRDRESNIESFVNMEMKRSRPHMWRSKEEAVKEVSWCFDRNYQKFKEQFPSAIWLEFPKYIHDFEYMWSKIGHLFPNGKEKTKEWYDEIVKSGMVRY